jgi:TRAP-type C4-dicarboxylate transport system permease small subunit
MLTRFNHWVTRALLVFAAILAFLLCFLVVADVVGRVVFNSPVKGTPEIISLSIVIICYLQCGFAIRSGGMLRVDTFISRLSPRTQSWLAMLGAIAGLFFFAVVCYGSFSGAAHAWDSNEFEGEGALRVPVWPAKFVIILGTGLACLSYLLMALESFRLAMHAQPPPESSVRH